MGGKRVINLKKFSLIILITIIITTFFTISANANNTNYAKLTGNMTLSNNASYEVQKMYSNCKKTLNNVQHIKDKVYNNLIIEVYTIEHNLLNTGDKVADRFGETKQLIAA